MTAWELLEGLALGAAAVSGAAAVACGSAWLLSRIARRWGTDSTPMGTTRRRFEKLPAKDVDAIRARAADRRARAAGRQTEVHQIATGKPEDRGRKLGWPR